MSLKEVITSDYIFLKKTCHYWLYTVSSDNVKYNNGLCILSPFLCFAHSISPPCKQTCMKLNEKMN